MSKFAIPITSEIVEMASQIAGCDADFPDELFIVVEMLSPTEFHAKIITMDEMVEAAKQDPALQVI